MGPTDVTTDDRGRITIPKPVRDRFGERYRLVELDDGIKLLPVPEDPVAALRDAAGADLRAASTEELEAAAREVAREETSEHVR